MITLKLKYRLKDEQDMSLIRNYQKQYSSCLHFLYNRISDNPSITEKKLRLLYDSILKDREFVCQNCGNKKDRDIHAANNMIYFYLKYYNAPGTDVSMPVKRVKFSKQILKQESTTSLV